MFLDWKNQYCENDYTIQSNLQIQCNPYQTTTGIFHRTRTKNFTICMETQKSPNSQSNLEKEEQPGGITFLISTFKVIVIQTVWYWHEKQNREARNKSTGLFF